MATLLPPLEGLCCVTSLSVFWDDCVINFYNIKIIMCEFFWLVFSRKRLKGTCDYIYQTLFLDGEGSDVTIEALG